MAAPKVTSRRRINVIVVVLTVLMAGTLIFRVGYWQVVKADDLKEMAADRCGATAIEYALIGSLISIMIVTGVSAIGTKLSGFFTQVSANLK